MTRTSDILLKYHGKGVTLAPLLFPPPPYYAAIARYEHAAVDTAKRFDKRRKATHRFEIADTRGRLSLTIPVEKPDFSARPGWCDVALSSHGQWWAKHLTALESAYGRTPFFEFYIDRFLHLFSPDAPARFPSVAHFALEGTNVVCRILGITPPAVAQSPDVEYTDLRQSDFDDLPVAPHYQVREAELGFINHLSVLDLIFNMGPDSPLYLNI